VIGECLDFAASRNLHLLSLASQIDMTAMRWEIEGGLL